MEGVFSTVTSNGRCYRKQQRITQLEGLQGRPSSSSSSLSVSRMEAAVDPEELAGLQVERLADGRVRLRVRCAETMLRFVVGKERANVRRMEERSGASIEVPAGGRRQRQPAPVSSVDLVLTGPSERSLLSAKREIESCLQRSLALLQPTHFVSIPLRSSELLERVESLNSSLQKVYGLDSTCFVTPEKLHLTLQVCKLFSPEQIDTCIGCIQRSVERFRVLFNESNAIHAHGTVSHRWSNRIHLAGLDFMGDDPRNTNVLYLKPERSLFTEQLGRLAEMLTEDFLDEGLLEESKAERGLLLHATVCNARYNVGDKKSTFDVSQIMADIGDYESGEVEVDKIVLAEIGSTDPSTGFFREVFSMDLVDTSLDLSAQ